MAATPVAALPAELRSARCFVPSLSALVEMDEPEESAGPSGTPSHTSHVGSRRSRYVPRDVLRKVRWRDAGRCQVPGYLNGRWTQLHHIRFFSRGGGRRTRNLLTLSTQHHGQLHDGHLVQRARDAERPRFTDAHGRPL